QVFIPYPRQGDHKAVCSLRVKYTSDKNDSLLSDPADIILAGRTVKTSPEVTVTSERPEHPSTLPTQQTHVATINRAGKVEPNSLNSATQQATAVNATTQKNTLVSHYEKKPQAVEQAAVCE